MKGKRSFQVGDCVLISRAGGRFNSLLETEEAGIVMATDMEYNCPKDGSSKPDGILVKLHITNTREVFPPDKVSPHLPISPPATRHQRRARITPSPALLFSDPGTAVVESSTAGSDVVLPDGEPLKKRTRDDLEATNDPLLSKERGLATSTTTKKKSSKYFAGCETSFRVQCAASSAGKCQSCREAIRKGILRLQPASEKRGWYHVNCAKETFSGTPVSGPDMDGYSDLAEAEQRLLETFLKGASTSDDVIKPPSMDVVQCDDDEDDADDPPLASLTTPKPSSKPKTVRKKPGKKKQTIDDGANNTVEEENESDDDMLRASETDSDDLKDKPFQIEYAATGRAACRGCDERIAKGELRVAEQPLFQGKPGYTVYRHLRCTVFGENIRCLQDVGGWRRLAKKDREAVSERVEESKILIEKENQELQPDELVQVEFQGEIRGSPKGLAANLLPFQVEGTSWMVHQEVHVPEIRGGILADEMVSRVISLWGFFSSPPTLSSNSPLLFCREWGKQCKPLLRCWTTGQSYNGPCQAPSTLRRLLI
jgi:hypothetical protein